MSVMGAPLSTDRSYNLRYAAAIIALALSMVGGALILYYLIDLLLIFFLGVIVATALQPAHLCLARWGIPKGLAVLFIYFHFLLIIVLLGLFVGPTLFEQISAFVASVPLQYEQFVADSRNSSNTFLQQLGSQLPSFSTIMHQLSTRTPTFVTNLWHFATSTVNFFVYFIVVLAIGFYWTMEVPRWERVVVSFVPTTRRQQVLEMWHEIEYKLGGFIRGQGLAMVTIGIASGAGYWLIGLPNVLVLAVLAGLLEAIPIIGPIFGVVPAVLVALPLGISSILLVLGFAALLQLFESNVLFPRIMNKTVGISSLLSLFAVLAFGSLYGVLGALVAIPLTVILHVLLEHFLVHPDPLPENTLTRIRPLEALRVRLEGMRQRLRERLRDRESRLQSGDRTQTGEQVADRVDQDLEKVVERADAIVTTAQQDDISTDEQQRVVSELERTVHTLEQSVAQVEVAIPAPTKQDEVPRQTPLPLPQTNTTVLQRVTQQAEAVVTSAEETLSEVQQNPEGSQTAPVQPKRTASEKD
jgi:predicted PurR-regulated permease PerM